MRGHKGYFPNHYIYTRMTEKNEWMNGKIQQIYKSEEHKGYFSKLF